MARLFRLEWKKFRPGRKFLVSMAAVVFSIFFITVSLADSFADPEQAKDSFDSAFLLAGLLMSSVFLVYSAVLTSSLVISEYSQRTITILFSYPLHKKSLIAAKMLLITAFTALSMLVGYVCCCVGMVGLDSAFDLLEGDFQISFLVNWIPDAVVSILVCCILLWWPFIIGMIRKSVPDTIVASLAALLARQLLITKNGAYHRESVLQVVLILALTLTAVGFVFRKKVARLD